MGLGNGRHPLAKLLVASSMIVLVAGCVDEQDYVKVTGKVTIDGEPLTQGIVRFYPEGGRQSGGELDSNGAFSLSTYEEGDGAAPGSYLIAVVAREPLSGNRFRWFTPRHYANPATSGLREQIDGPTEVEINLTWGDRKGPFVEQM